MRPSEGPPLRRFFRGMGYPFRGFAFLLRHRDLWDVAIGPLLITMAMLLGAFWASVLLADDLFALIWARPVAGDPIERSIGWTFAVNSFRLLVFVGLAVPFWVVGNMIGSPFWDALAERTERHLLDRPDTPFDLRIALGDAWQSVRHSLAALALYVAVMGTLLVINLIPVAGSVAYVLLSWPATVFFVVREVMDVPLSRRRTPFRSKLGWILERKALLAGLGTTSLLLFVVPLMNVFVMPIAVMGGTLLYCHLHLEGHGVPQLGPGRRREPLPEPAAAE